METREYLLEIFAIFFIPLLFLYTLFSLIVIGASLMPGLQ